MDEHPPSPGESGEEHRPAHGGDPLSPSETPTGGTTPASYDPSIIPGAAAPSRTIGTRAIVAGVLVAAVAATGGIVALRQGAPSAALEAVAPADSAVFVKIDRDPSVDQKRALRALLDRLPEADRARVGDGIDDLLQGVLDGVGLDYAADVKPWLGDEAGLVVRVDPNGGSPGVVGMLQATNEAAARNALTQAARENRDFAFSVEDGIAFVSSEATHISAVRTATATIGDHTPYTRARDRVGDHLAIVWFDGARFAELGGRAAQGFAPGILGTNPFMQNLGGAGAFGLRAEADGLALRGFQSGGEQEPTAGKPSLAESMPADQIGSLTFFDLAKGLESGLEALSQGFDGQSPVAMVEQGLRDALGLDLRKDVLAWMHGEFTVVVGGFTRPPIPDAGIVIEPTDPAALQRTMSALAARLNSLAGSGFPLRLTRPTANGFDLAAGDVLNLAVRRGADRLVIATSPAYAQTLLGASAASLGEDAVYRRVVGPPGETVGFQMFVRLDRILQLVQAFLPAPSAGEPGTDTALVFLRTFPSVGMRATVKGNEIETHLLLSVAS